MDELEEEVGYRILFHQGKPQYRFTLAARRLQDYAGMCRYHQTSPASSFTRNRLITQVTPEGRITLSDTSFVVTLKWRSGEERPVSGPEEFNALYADISGRPRKAPPSPSRGVPRPANGISHAREQRPLACPGEFPAPCQRHFPSASPPGLLDNFRYGFYMSSGN